ncbi:universal stress protein [Streptomyces sp. NPDC088354]|uniref:universal stress protein n=1 Tax=unclassified Streptomyces TaxID=2593676 RepID=UPI0029BB9615|nr:universal stress protein [Streptomyces sp. MI02-7b]MDX3077789.1 universal stress protein [Streptomyces sp. MI02-7b]
MPLPLVVGTDGSDAALIAVDWAADEAALRGSELRIVYASLWERYEGSAPSLGAGRTTERGMTERILASAGQRALLRRPEIEVTREVLAEEAEEALLHLSHQAAAIVVGSRGRGEFASQLLGSVGLTVAAKATCPVVVIRGDGADPGGRPWITLGIDPAGGSGDAACVFAFTEARLRGWGVLAVHAWRTPHGVGPDWEGWRDSAAHKDHAVAVERLDQALRRPTADFPDVPVERLMPEGRARPSLLDAAGGAGLLVVGARRRRSPVGLQLGPVNHAVLHHAPCPVAVVPDQA